MNFDVCRLRQVMIEPGLRRALLMVGRTVFR
jgi:hypothetical protein